MTEHDVNQANSICDRLGIAYSAVKHNKKLLSELNADQVEQLFDRVSGMCDFIGTNKPLSADQSASLSRYKSILVTAAARDILNVSPSSSVKPGRYEMVVARFISDHGSLVKKFYGADVGGKVLQWADDHISFVHCIQGLANKATDNGTQG